MVVSFLVYILVFSAALGIKPDQSLKYAKFKIEHVKADSTAMVEQDTVITEDLMREIDKARRSIADEKADLQSQKERLIKEKEKLEALREEIQQLLADKRKAEEERMYNLAKIYDGMDQESVAKVFSQMEDSLVVVILPKMKPANASQVLEFLPPDRSARISKMLLVKGA
ncbi:MAG: hypothetical protein DRP26_01185 [Candidatus Zixiibacteriota bacterium]|nr:MAG: hypothetical protein DRP26_01185 [candidate division Zixibacteria bacterium]